MALKDLVDLNPYLSFVSVYRTQELARSFFHRELYYLLQERQSDESISHKEMPSYQDHVRFVTSEPYKEWWVLQNDVGQVVGCCYLTNDYEIGISIFDIFRGRRYATKAIQTVIELYPDKELKANINPRNQKSINLFVNNGFILYNISDVQHTYILSR